MKKVLVAGGAGFIGSRLVDKLVEKENEIIVIDNLSTGKEKNINKKAKFYKIDIKNKTILEKIFMKEKPQFVYHLAAQASVISSVKEPANDAENNIIGTINILENCVKYKIKKIVYSSSGGALYGNPVYLPSDEHHIINPLCPYGLSKYVSEQYICMFNQLYGLPFLILRYSNVYGPRQDSHGESGVIAIFIEKMLKNEKPIIFGDGTQTRDFIYVDDAVNASLKLKKGIYNIATEKETSINEIFSLIKESLESKIKPVYSKVRKEEIYKSCLAIRKAQKEGWSPKVEIEEGIKKSIGWFKNAN